MLCVKQVFISGNQYVRRTVQGSSRNPLIVSVPLGPRSRSDGRYHFCILTDKRNNLCNLVRWRSKFVPEYSFEFRENRVADKQLVFSEYDLEYVPA